MSPMTLNHCSCCSIHSSLSLRELSLWERHLFEYLLKASIGFYDKFIIPLSLQCYPLGIHPKGVIWALITVTMTIPYCCYSGWALCSTITNLWLPRTSPATALPGSIPYSLTTVLVTPGWQGIERVIPSLLTKDFLPDLNARALIVRGFKGACLRFCACPRLKKCFDYEACELL